MKDKHFKLVGVSGTFYKNIFLLSCVGSFIFFYGLVWVPFQKIPPRAECRLKGSSDEFKLCSIDEFCSSDHEIKLLPEESINNWFISKEIPCSDQKWFFDRVIQLLFISKFVYCAFLSFLPDKYGRRPVMMVTMLLMIVLNICLLLIEDLFLFLAVFFISSMHFLFVNILVYTSEIITQKQYAFLTTVLSSIYPVAGVAVGWAYLFFKDWVIVHWIVIAGLGCCLVNFYLMCPETPKFCLSNNKIQEFKDSFNKMALINGNPPVPEEKLDEIVAASIKAEKADNGGFFKEFINNSKYRQDLLVLTFCVGVTRFVFNGTFMNIDRIDANVILFSRVLFVSEIIGNFLGGYLANIFGRKTVLRYGFGLSAVSFLIFYWSFDIFYLKLIFIGLSTGIDAMVLNVVMILASETYNPRLRSTSLNFSILLADLLNASIPILVTSRRSFLLFAVLLLICFVLINIPDETLRRDSDLRDSINTTELLNIDSN